MVVAKLRVAVEDPLVAKEYKFAPENVKTGDEPFFLDGPAPRGLPQQTGTLRVGSAARPSRKSMGGRIASHIVADGFPAAGLVFLGYPLHPPGKPERIRDAHLRQIKVPMLFLQGTQDSFATADLLHRTVMSLPGARLVEIEGGDHSFKVRGRAPADVMAELIDAMARFISEHAH